MQMDSVDRGSQTADFGARKSFNNSSILSEKDASGYHDLVEEVNQTFTSIRDIKRKQAIEVTAQLLAKAKFQAAFTRAAFEAV